MFSPITCAILDSAAQVSRATPSAIFVPIRWSSGDAALSKGVPESQERGIQDRRDSSHRVAPQTFWHSYTKQNMMYSEREFIVSSPPHSS